MHSVYMLADKGFHSVVSLDANRLPLQLHPALVRLWADDAMVGPSLQAAPVLNCKE